MERREKVSGVVWEVRERTEERGRSLFSSAQNCMLRVNASATRHAPPLRHKPRASPATCHSK